MSDFTIYQHAWTAAVFLRKYEAQEPFELVKGSKIKKVIFSIDDYIIDAIKKNSSKVNSLILLSEDRTSAWNFKDLASNIEFGGKVVNVKFSPEDKAAESLNCQIEAAKIKDGTATIQMKIGSKKYEVYALDLTPNSNPSNPKSDFHLLDVDGEEIIWISHKAGSSPKDFHQWGGISSKEISNHDETKLFVDDIKLLYPGGLPRTVTLYRKIRDTRLKLLAMYGNDYGSRKMGRNNVTMIVQGDIKLVKANDVYEIKANHVHLNGKLLSNREYDPVLMANDPVLMATHKGDRSDFDIRGTRLTISPIGGRRGIDIDSIPREKIVVKKP